MQKARGFTVVELSVVIVVIAILASITIVSYNHVTARANDSLTRQGVNKFEKAMKLWSLKTNDRRPLGNSGSTLPLSGSNCRDGGGQGWVHSGVYTCTTEDFLVAGGFLPENFMYSLPVNKSQSASLGGKRSIMLYSCLSGSNRYLLMWSLQQPTADDTAQFDAVLAECGRTGSASTFQGYGMRSAKVLYL